MAKRKVLSFREFTEALRSLGFEVIPAPPIDATDQWYEEHKDELIVKGIAIKKGEDRWIEE
jgi:hypothetical protein